MIAFAWGAYLFAALAGFGRPQECERDFLTSLRAADQTYLVATATGDTTGVRASADVASAGSAVRSDAWPMSGQVVNVGRMVGPTPRESGSKAARAVLVPWQGGHRCQRERWTSSARWIRTGVRGVFLATLRPRPRWISGLPTFDVELAERQPYPQHESLAWANTRRPLLGIDSLIEFLAVQPTAEADAANPVVARRPLWSWARLHLRAASREPASFLLVNLCDDLLRLQSQAVRSPVSGTYRWRVTLSGDQPRLMFAQTAAHPDGVVHPATTDQRELYCSGGGAGEEYSLPVTVVASEGDFAMQGQAHRSKATASIFIGRMRQLPTGTATWAAEVDPILFEKFYPEAPLFHEFRVAWTDYQAGIPEGTRLPAPGVFRRMRDGSIVFEQDLRLPNGRTLSVRGQRISQAVQE
jgi:hypothetical protein